MPKLLLAAVLFALAPVLAGCSTLNRTGVETMVESSGVEERWGIRVEGLRLTAQGHMCDFRFRVIDAEKAAPLLDRKKPASLLNESTGIITHVPAMPKVGPLRQTVRLSKPAEGRTYFIIFANPGKLIKTGQRATVSIGDFVMPGLVVQ